MKTESNYLANLYEALGVLILLSFIVFQYFGVGDLNTADAKGQREVLFKKASTTTITAESVKTFMVSTNGFTDLKLSFLYDSNKLEDYSDDGDSFVYGWSLETKESRQKLGIIKGMTNSESNGNGEGQKERGSIFVDISKTQAQSSNFVLYFKNTGTNNDQIKISGLQITGIKVESQNQQNDNGNDKHNNDGDGQSGNNNVDDNNDSKQDQTTTITPGGPILAPVDVGEPDDNTGGEVKAAENTNFSTLSDAQIKTQINKLLRQIIRILIVLRR